MPFLRNIGFVVTYRCQVACPHCILRAGPTRTEAIATRDEEDWIRAVADYRDGHIRVLSLTGGEPFFDLDALRRIAEAAHARGLLVSAVTNAFWATTPDEARRILKGIPSMGMLSISTDAYHQAAVPLERVEHAMAAAREAGVPFTVAVCTESEDDPRYRATLQWLAPRVPASDVLTAITFRAGRALDSGGGRSAHRMSSTPPRAACSAGSSPIVMPNGDVVACIGPVVDLRPPHPLFLGSLRARSLAAILDEAEVNSILHAIRVWGPRALVEVCRKAGLERLLPREYVADSACDACYQLISDPALRPFLASLAADRKFAERVAYARAYYLREVTMAERLGLTSAPARPSPRGRGSPARGRPAPRSTTGRR
jgi:organic radical activating enzyme